MASAFWGIAYCCLLLPSSKIPSSRQFHMTIDFSWNHFFLLIIDPRFFSPIPGSFCWIAFQQSFIQIVLNAWSNRSKFFVHGLLVLAHWLWHFDQWQSSPNSFLILVLWSVVLVLLASWSFVRTFEFLVIGLWGVIISPCHGIGFWFIMVLKKLSMMKTRVNCKSSNITVSDLRKCTKSSLTFHNQNADHDGHDDDGDEGDDDDDVLSRK